jgi:hypothetical protein
MTSDCFNDVVGASEPFVGPTQTAEPYRKHREGFPDFTVRVASYARTKRALSRRMNGATRDVPGVTATWKASANARDRGLALQGLLCGARRSFSIMPPCFEQIGAQMKSRQPLVR